MSNQFDIWAALPTFSLCYFTARDLTFTVPIPSHFARFVSDVNNLRILSSARTHDRMIPAHTILAQILWLSVPSIQFTAFLLLLVFTCGHHLLLPLAQSSASKVMLSSKKRVTSMVCWVDGQQLASSTDFQEWRSHALPLNSATLMRKDCQTPWIRWIYQIYPLTHNASRFNWIRAKVP